MFVGSNYLLTLVERSTLKVEIAHGLNVLRQHLVAFNHGMHIIENFYEI